VKRDCSDAARLWAGNTKAYFRKARACLELRQYEDGLEAALGALGLDPGNEDVLALQAKLGSGLAERQAREAKVREAEARELAAQCDLFKRLTQKSGAKLGPGMAADGYSQQASDKLPTLSKDDLGEEFTAWPCYFLYPQYQTSDFVEELDERCLVAEALAMVFPEEATAEPPVWDARREYRCSALEAYVQLGASPSFESAQEWAAWTKLKRAARGEVFDMPADAASKRLRAMEARAEVHPLDHKWLRVPAAVTLGDVLKSKDHVIGGGVVNFYLYPRDSQAHADFLKSHGGRVIPWSAPKDAPLPVPP